jgi:hypothetical protein
VTPSVGLTECEAQCTLVTYHYHIINILSGLQPVARATEMEPKRHYSL